MSAKKVVKAAKTPAALSAFQSAVRVANLDAAPYFALGLGAVKGCYRPCIQARDTRRLRGSLDIDGALEALEPGNHRWDYGVGLQLAGSGPEIAVWVEFHPASTSEVDVVLKKLDWLRGKLQIHKQLNKLTNAAAENGVSCFHWLPTDSGVHIPMHTPQYKKLAARGLCIKSRVLHLP